MNRLITFTLAGVLLLSAAAYGQDPDGAGELEKLRRTVEEQNRTISDLVGRMQALEGDDDTLDSMLARYEEEHGVSFSFADGSSWTDRISLGGDFRYRHEFIDADRDDKRDRHRQRLRVRLNLAGEVNDEITFRFQVSTASDEDSYGGDPGSNNQTLTNQWSMKHLWISRAYVE